MPEGSFLRESLQTCQAFLQLRDKSSESSCRKDLENAEKKLKEAKGRNPNCRKCSENLGYVYFAKSYFGFADDYGDAIVYLESEIRRYPDSPSITFLLGCTYYGVGRSAESARLLTRYLQVSTGDPAQDEYARRLLKAISLIDGNGH